MAAGEYKFQTTAGGRSTTCQPRLRRCRASRRRFAGDTDCGGWRNPARAGRVQSAGAGRKRRGARAADHVFAGAGRLDGGAADAGADQRRAAGGDAAHGVAQHRGNFQEIHQCIEHRWSARIQESRSSITAIPTGSRNRERKALRANTFVAAKAATYKAHLSQRARCANIGAPVARWATLFRPVRDLKTGSYKSSRDKRLVRAKQILEAIAPFAAWHKLCPDERRRGILRYAQNNGLGQEIGRIR